MQKRFGARGDLYQAFFVLAAVTAAIGTPALVGCGGGDDATTAMSPSQSPSSVDFNISDNQVRYRFSDPRDTNANMSEMFNTSLDSFEDTTLMQATHYWSSSRATVFTPHSPRGNNEDYRRLSVSFEYGRPTFNDTKPPPYSAIPVTKFPPADPAVGYPPRAEVTYTESAGGQFRQWRGAGGTVWVMDKDHSHIRLRVEGVHFSPDPDVYVAGNIPSSPNTAAGSFTVSGEYRQSEIPYIY